MKILSCHIENFGRLSGLDFDFSKNPTVIFEKNGWGKTTLSAFLKSMFYGLPDGRVKSAENARVKYKPWQGGVYGGSLTFERGGKRYLVKRVFADGAKGDEVKIYDAVTYLETTDFPFGKESLGECLFGVDEKGYEKLVYLPQNSVEIRLDGGLQAALLRSRESLDGGEDVERAVAAIEAEERELRAKRKPAKGRLDDLDEQIARLEEEIYFAKKEGENCALLQAELCKIEEEILRCSAPQSREEDKKSGKIGALVAYLLAALGAVGCFIEALPFFACLALFFLSLGVGVWLTVREGRRLGGVSTGQSQEALSALWTQKQALFTKWQQASVAAQASVEKEAQLARLKEEKIALEKRAWRLKTARELLLCAKAQSAGNYLRPLTERCRKLFEKFYPQKALVLTAEGEVRLDEAGALREGAYYSAGMRAALGICIRLALVETLFEREKPVLVLDDPFVDMDEENLSLARAFLSALKQEYQIVYLTCHESRLL